LFVDATDTNSVGALGTAVGDTVFSSIDRDTLWQKCFGAEGAKAVVWSDNETPPSYPTNCWMLAENDPASSTGAETWVRWSRYGSNPNPEWSQGDLIDLDDATWSPISSSQWASKWTQAYTSVGRKFDEGSGPVALVGFDDEGETSACDHCNDGDQRIIDFKITYAP
jgi:hypothetical protein